LDFRVVLEPRSVNRGGLGFNHVEAQPRKAEEEKIPEVLDGFYHNFVYTTRLMPAQGERHDVA
jgi:hypothetical protein